LLSKQQPTNHNHPNKPHKKKWNPPNIKAKTAEKTSPRPTSKRSSITQLGHQWGDNLAISLTLTSYLILERISSSVLGIIFSLVIIT
jgi:hypothetical protein